MTDLKLGEIEITNREAELILDALAAHVNSLTRVIAETPKNSAAAHWWAKEAAETNAVIERLIDDWYPLFLTKDSDQ